MHLAPLLISCDAVPVEFCSFHYSFDSQDLSNSSAAHLMSVVLSCEAFPVELGPFQHQRRPFDVVIAFLSGFARRVMAVLGDFVLQCRVGRPDGRTMPRRPSRL